MASSEVRRALRSVAFDPELVRRKMIFVAGPRQAGKTTFARSWLAEHGSEALYFNWDDAKVRARWREDPHFFEPAARRLAIDEPWVALDEIHKAARWRDMLKGWYDVFGEELRFLVTGSARLDLFRRGGDALVGRSLLFHLMPLSLGELLGEEGPPALPAWLASPARSRPRWDAPPEAREAFELLLRRGPFPEPLLADSDRFDRRWKGDYLTLIVRGEARDLTRITHLDGLEALVSLLPSTVGSPLSLASLGRDLEVAHTTVKTWMEALRRLYLVFRLSPWTRRVRRALRKAKKWYLLDWSHVRAEGPRLESLVASALWQACLAWTDAGLGRLELAFLRTLDKREIDFVVVRDGEPVAAVEVKTGDLQPSRTLLRRREHLGRDVHGLQVVGVPGVARQAAEGLWVVSAERLLSQLP